jgi:LMBR1 domain-containing protein 1
MSVVAIRIIKGNKRVESEKRELEIELQNVSKVSQELEEKYSGRRMPEKYRTDLEKATYQKEQIEAKLAVLNDLQNAAIWRRIYEALLPFKFLVGVGILLISLAIIISMGFTQIIRFLSSDCGWACGFVITSNQVILNPLDLLLTYSSRVSSLAKLGCLFKKTKQQCLLIDPISLSE